MNTLVIYYSRKGSNEYLAKKIARELSCDIERIKPNINSFAFTLMNIKPGIGKIVHPVKSYDKVILVGPIFMGRFIPPLRSFLKQCKHQINELVFVTCCGSSDAKKEEKFGHGHVFFEVKEIMGDIPTYCRAFPIDLVLPEELKDDDKAFMETHLSDANFKGEIEERFRELIEKIKESTHSEVRN